ncbi:MAG: methyltransferase domain-containing protein [Thermomicrobiales bacterium]
MATETWQIEATAAETYEKQLVPALFAEWAPRLVDAAGVQQGDWVLDVACGTGVVAREAAERVGSAGRVTGLDLNPGMLAVARRLRPDLTWREGDATALPFADGAFDRVLCQFALMYVPDRVAALREMRRVLAPAGTVGLAVWNAIDHSPAFVLLSEILARHAGPRAADILRSPFVLGDLDEVRSLLTAAELSVLRTETRVGAATFSSVDAFVHAEVDGSPLAGLLHAHGDAVYQHVIKETREALRPFCSQRGLSSPIEAHLFVAQGS